MPNSPCKVCGSQDLIWNCQELIRKTTRKMGCGLKDFQLCFRCLVTSTAVDQLLHNQSTYRTDFTEPKLVNKNKDIKILDSTGPDLDNSGTEANVQKPPDNDDDTG